MTWARTDLDLLSVLAGRLSIEEISANVGKPVKEVEVIAKVFGIDIRYYERVMDWCPECGAYRSQQDNGCRVCELKQQLQRLREDNAEAFLKLSEEEQEKHRERDARRRSDFIDPPVLPDLKGLSGYERRVAEEQRDLLIEQWEIEQIKREKDRVKHETWRIRQKLKGGKA